jgi:hypothetical protein
MTDHRSSQKRSGNNRNKSSYRQNSDEALEPKAVSQAMRKEGGAGGVSGTGQALPHHGFDDDAGREAVANPVGDEAKLPMPEAGSTYQVGATHLNRIRQEETRKTRLAGATVASKGKGGLERQEHRRSVDDQQERTASRNG